MHTISFLEDWLNQFCCFSVKMHICEVQEQFGFTPLRLEHCLTILIEETAATF